MNTQFRIYGSTAIKYYFPDFKREPNDIDLIIEDESTLLPEYKMLLSHLKSQNKRIEKYYSPALDYLINNCELIHLTPDILFTIKFSHIPYHTRNFDKHLFDFEFLKSKGCQLNLKLLHLLRTDWDNLFGAKRVKLNCTNEEFFKSNITREFNHDWLHEQICYYNEPLHLKIRKDHSSPLCSKELFDQLTFEDQMNLAMEETMVYMLERYLLTCETKSFKIAHYKALKQLITSSTKGFFNDFLIWNFKELLSMDVNDKFKLFYGLHCL